MTDQLSEDEIKAEIEAAFGDTRPMKPIPIVAAVRIAKDYGYDQVVIIGRRVGEDPNPRGEHVTTYGINPTHCDVAAVIGNHIKHDVMKWERELDHDIARDITALKAQLAEYTVPVFYSISQYIVAARDHATAYTGANPFPDSEQHLIGKQVLLCGSGPRRVMEITAVERFQRPKLTQGELLSLLLKEVTPNLAA